MSATELAAVLAAVIVVASIASVELGVSVALLELGLGVVAFGLVLPLAHRHVPEHATFSTLLMSTGLTFGTTARSMASTRGSSIAPSSRCS